MHDGFKIIDKQFAKATAPDGSIDLHRLKKMVAATYEDFERDAERIDRSMRLMIEENDRLTRDLEATIKALGLENAGYAPALENMSHGLCIFDADNRLLVANSRFQEIYDLPKELVRPGVAMARLLDAIKEHEKGRGCTTQEGLGCMALGKTPGDSLRSEWALENGAIVEVVATRVKDGGLVAVHEDVTEKRKAQAHIERLARHDALTGLPNRATFHEILNSRLSDDKAGNGIAIYYLDLDRFKAVNDTFGHAVGDELLRQVAKRLRHAVRDKDVVARFSGDEFAVIQQDVADPEAVEMVAQRVLDGIGNRFKINDHLFHIGASIGVSLFPSDSRDADRLIKNADIALYRAKADGGNTFRFYEPTMDANMRERRSLEFELQEAVENEDFELFYQPLFDLKQNRICAFEALLRWNSPLRGRVPPAAFIGLAEETGLIAPIGKWVLRQACREAMKWPNDLKVAVNVSAKQFKAGDLPLLVAAALAESGLAPSRVELEVTESVLLQNTEHTIDALRQLKDLGVSISMDDFGAGYSSLSYLYRFPFDKLKIDRSFVCESDADDNARSIIRAMTGLGRSIGMKIVAEGVETRDQLQAVRSEGCGEIQGYLISKPIPVNEIADLLAAQAAAA